MSIPRLLRSVIAFVCVCLLSGSVTAVAATDKTPEDTPPEVEDEDDGTGLHVRSGFALRYEPIGTRLAVDGGYKWSLFDSDSLLLKDTYLEAGVTTETSPSNFWGGPYVEIVPTAVLKLRVAFQSLSYYGTFGYLHIPSDQSNPAWGLDDLDGDADAGQSASGWMLTLQAQPQAKVGNVVFLAPLQYRWIDMGVDQSYYESSFDMLLEPTDTMWVARPTLGWVFSFEGSDSWLLTGARWEHAQSSGHDLSRDMATFLGLWQLPGDLSGGTMKWALLTGYWLDHPSRAGTPYLASEFSVDWSF